MDNQVQEERRQYERYLFREDILIDGAKQAYSQNICPGGMFISILHPYEKGTAIHVTIRSNLTVKARVTNSQSGIGMGIEFIDLTSDQQKELKQLIENIKLIASENST